MQTLTVAGSIVQEGIPLSPAVLVNWLYQACADVVALLNRRLGDGQFDSNGFIQDGISGECALMWGSFLGAVRDHAMAAWDFDVDIAVFLAMGVDWATVWTPLTHHMSQLGY